jgi:hypothetical protein
MAPITVDLSSVLVYPNPSKGDFGLLFSSQNTSGVLILVHDLLGRKVFEKEFPSAPLFNETVQLSNIQAGVYLLTIIDGNNSTVKKLVLY